MSARTIERSRAKQEGRRPARGGFVLAKCGCGGGPANMIQLCGEGRLAWVVCTACGIETEKFTDSMEAGEAWNAGEVRVPAEGLLFSDTDLERHQGVMEL